ncbi:MAG: TlpA disulfide reductase family protein [Flavobacteriales bacterium]
MRFALSIALLALCLTTQAQRITGQLRSSGGPDTVALLATIGHALQPVASAPVNKHGRFTFPQLHLEVGFYKLALNDTDRVDLILGPHDPEVHLSFTGTPLQEHITVDVSTENIVLWRYKAISRSHQQALAAIRAERLAASPRDADLLEELTAREQAADAAKMRELDALIEAHPASYFAYAVTVDRRLMAALPQGLQAWRDAADLCDRRLLRSNLFAKVVLGNLQLGADRPLEQVCDELLAQCRTDSLVWSAMRAQLLDLFNTHGPDLVAQYLVDRYVAGADAAWMLDPWTRKTMERRIACSIGAQVSASDPWPFRSGGVERTDQVLGRAPLTLVFFFSSTCGHCHEEMPGVEALHQRYVAAGLQVVGVALDTDSTELAATVREKSLTFPVASSFIAWGEPLAKAWGVNATPSLILLDRERRILAKPFDHVEAEREVEQRLLVPTR